MMTMPTWGPARRRCALAFVLFIATAALWSSFFTTRRFVDRDAYDYAQIGRQIRQGHAYTTRQTFPRHLPYMQQHQYLEGEWPSLLRYPATPTLNAVSQLVLADPVLAAVAQTGLWFLLSVPLFFCLAAKLTDTRLACVATVLFAGDPRIWRNSYNGMTESFALLLVLAVVCLLFVAAARRGRWQIWLAQGLLCGLAYLTRTQLVLLLPLGFLAAATLVRRGARWRSAALVLAGAILIASPWMVRNLRVAGDPLFSFTNSRNLLAQTESRAGADRYLNESVRVRAVLAARGDEIFAKVGRNLWPRFVDPSFWIGALGVYAVVFPILGLALALRRWRPLDRRRFVVFERATLLLLLSNFLLVSLSHHRQRFYDPLIPLLILLLVQRVASILGLLRPLAGQQVRRAGFVLWLVLAGARWLVTLDEHVTTPGVAEVDQRAYDVLRELIDPGAVVVTDLSAQVTLYLGNRTVRLPVVPEEILEIDAELLPIDAVLITKRQQESRYRSFLDSASFRSRYEPVARLPNEALLFRRIAASEEPSRPRVQSSRGKSGGPRYYAAQLHLHGSFSEGPGTMRGHNIAARSVGGIDVLWWTDHDWRLVRHSFLSSFAFEALTAEHAVPARNLPWRQAPRQVSYGLQEARGGAGLASSEVGLTESARRDGGKALRIEAVAPARSDRWGWAGAVLTADGGRFQAALAAEVVLRVSVQPLRLSDDARSVVRLGLSRQAEGLAELQYVLGDGGERRVERRDGRIVGIVPLTAAGKDWRELVLPVTDDAVALGLGGWDNSLRSIRLAVQVRRGASAAIRFDDLRIETRLKGEELLARELVMAEELQEELGLVNHVGSELSYSIHMSAYLPRIELPDFERYPSGMSGAEIVHWVHERGGVVSYNHVFGTGSSSDPVLRRTRSQRLREIVVSNHAFGADLLEVGYPLRLKPLRDHLEVWDELSAERVFLTAIGSSDSHDHVNGWFDGNNFVTWIWAASPSREDLIEGLRHGRAFLGDPTRFRGTLDLETTDGHAMGRVVVAHPSPSELRLRLSALPRGTTIRWIADGETVKTSTPPSGDYEERLRVDTRTYRYVRVEVWSGERGLAFSNCLYFVPATDGSLPATHRRVDERGGSTGTGRARERESLR